jgi:hypothetical protein
LTPGDAGQFRDYLLDCGMSSSSVRRVIASVRVILFHVRSAFCVLECELLGSDFDAFT